MCGITSSTHTLIITSIKEIQTLYGITSAKINIAISIYPIISLGYTFTDTPIVLVRTTFSSDLEEAMTESGESLSNSKNYCSVFEKISKTHFSCSPVLGSSFMGVLGLVAFLQLLFR